MLGNSPSKTLTYDWQSLVRSVRTAFDQGELSKAEDLCWESLTKAKMIGEFEPRLAISLSNLAVIQRSRGQRDRAEDLSNIALRILQAVDSGGRLMSGALLNSACFYHDEGRWGEARRLYTKAIQILEKGFLETELCPALCLYARLCSDQTRYSQAETLLKRVASLDPDDPQCTILYLVTSAQNSIRQGRLSRAEQTLSEADVVLKERLGLHLAWKSSVLSVRGDLLSEQYQASQNVSGSVESDIAGRKRAVMEAYEHALDIREQTLGPFHPGCAQILYKQAQFHYQLSEYSECEENLRKSLSICLSSRGPYHWDTLNCLELSGLVLRSTNRHEEAEEMEERARQVERRVRELGRETYVVWGDPDE
jgi:tetratricopeptide (TPR) repeat protein